MKTNNLVTGARIHTRKIRHVVESNNNRNSTIQFNLSKKREKDSRDSLEPTKTKCSIAFYFSPP